MLYMQFMKPSLVLSEYPEKILVSPQYYLKLLLAKLLQILMDSPGTQPLDCL
ncbi:hypothetical protein DPMN_161489 [Dreissena polymorpha]|uniref:Uncharacterized protein n=1 Tax=Dreissena polymorpha TaxID=45954 RepID=A0A9D4EMS9_DREPO|nr:hypothetical protein DPMN_161489 [Dreissena polymorpha]